MNHIDYNRIEFFQPSPLFRGLLILLEIDKDPSITQKRLSNKVGLTSSMINNYLKDFVGSINGLLLWAIEILLLIFVCLGIYVLVYNPEKQLGGIFLIIFSGLLAASILYIIYLKYRIRAKLKLSK